MGLIYLTDRLKSCLEAKNFTSWFHFSLIIQHWVRDLNSNMDRKNYCLYKRNPVVKTAAEEKPAAGPMVWPAKDDSMEMIMKWQHPKDTQEAASPHLPRLSGTQYTECVGISSGHSTFPHR